VIPIETAMSWRVLQGAAVATGLLAGVILAIRRAPAVAIGLAWVPLGLLPVLQLVPILNVAAERFLYLPSVGWCLALGALAARASRGPRSRWIGAALGVVLAGYAVRSLVRAGNWHDDLRLNETTARDFPEDPVPLLNLARLHRDAGRPQEARSAAMEALRRAPGWPPAEHLIAEIPIAP
jgi:hypothetical protein